MAYCPDCGTEVDEQASFCESCGSELQTSNTTQEYNTGEPATSTDSEPVTDDGIDWKHAGVATLIALIPAFGVYMLISIATYSVSGLAFFVALPLFGYLLYQRPTGKAMLGGMCFWLAVEAFLSPVVMLFYTATYSAQETSTAAGEAGAAIGGGLLMIMAFVVGLPIGIVLYLVSRRLDVDDSQSDTSPQPA